MGEFVVTLANGKRFGAAAGVAMLDAALAAGLPLEHGCRNGQCGSCRVKVLEGRTTRVGADTALTADEHAEGWVLSCAEGAACDVALDTEDLSALQGISARTLPARISVLQPMAEDVVRVVLRLPPTAGLRFLPGQYVNVVGPNGLRRAYSIANAPAADGLLEFFIRRVPGGAFSEYWFTRAAINDLLRIDGPRGSFYARDVAGRDLVLLATGTGIAPLKALLEGLVQAEVLPRSIHLLWGGRTPADLFWTPDFPTLPLRYTPVLSRAGAAWAGSRGHVQDVLLAEAGSLAATDVYACGSPEMIASARPALVAAGLAPRRFFSDAFVSST